MACAGAVESTTRLLRSWDLNLTDDPVPVGERNYSEYAWPVVGSVEFEPFRAPVGRTFVDVFENRRTVRQLTVAPKELVVGTLLYATMARAWKMQDTLGRSRRPAMSAGALHPISILVFDDTGTYRLNTESCSLDELGFPGDARSAWLAKCSSVLPGACGTLLVLVADLARPMSAYMHCETLVWRDAGAVLQTIGLTAELFGLGFCPLGILGNEVVSALPTPEYLLPVGTAAIGWPNQS